MFYTIAFYRDFCGHLVGTGEKYLSVRIYTTTDKLFALDHARRMNNETNVNIQVEHFQVWESPTQKYSKKSKLIYPTNENSLF